jgi:hypothetical protein
MRANIYIRKDNEKAWDDLADKSATVNHWLITAKGSPSTIKVMDELAPTPSREIVEKYSKGLCEHSQVKGKCMWKGCKYAR